MSYIITSPLIEYNGENWQIDTRTSGICHNLMQPILAPNKQSPVTQVRSSLFSDLQILQPLPTSHKTAYDLDAPII